MADFNAVRIDEMEAIYAGGFKRARAALEVTSFGLSVSDLPPDYDHVPAHTHTFDGQEEIYVTLGGGGWLEVDGERVALDGDSVVLVAPEGVRRPIAGPEGLRVLSVGAVPGEAYEPFPNSEAGAPEVPVPELAGVKAAAEAAEAGTEPPSEPRFTAKRFEEMDSYKNAFHYVRASLGISAFGVSMFKLPPNWADYPRHDETHSRQEEVYVPLEGSAELEVEGQALELVPGMMVRVGPEATRKIVPGDDGLSMLAIGGIPGAPYEPVDFSKVKKDEG